MESAWYIWRKATLRPLCAEPSSRSPTCPKRTPKAIAPPTPTRPCLSPATFCGHAASSDYRKRGWTARPSRIHRRHQVGSAKGRQCQGHGRRRLHTLLGLFGHHSSDNAGQAARHIGVEILHGLRLGGHVLEGFLHYAAPGEGCLSGQQEITCA